MAKHPFVEKLNILNGKRRIAALNTAEKFNDYMISFVSPIRAVRIAPLSSIDIITTIK